MIQRFSFHFVLFVEGVSYINKKSLAGYVETIDIVRTFIKCKQERDAIWRQ